MLVKVGNTVYLVVALQNEDEVKAIQELVKLDVTIPDLLVSRFGNDRIALFAEVLMKRVAVDVRRSDSSPKTFKEIHDETNER